MGRATDNAIMKSMQTGQLYYRAKIINATSKNAVVNEPSIREEKNKPYNNVTFSMTYNDTLSNIDTNIEIK